MFPIHGLDIAPKITQPLLCINMQSFQTEINLKDLRKYTTGEQPVVRENYTIRHTTHENQSDSVHLIGYWLNLIMKKLNPVTATRLNNALIVRFLREQMTGGLPSLAENCLHDHSSYIVNDLTINGVNNRTKQIPTHYFTFI